MRPDPNPHETYEHLLTLWTSGVRDYRSLLSDYLTANSIFVAVIGLMVSRKSLAPLFTIMIVVLSIFRVLLCFQMAIVLDLLLLSKCAVRVATARD